MGNEAMTDQQAIDAMSNYEVCELHTPEMRWRKERDGSVWKQEPGEEWKAVSDGSKHLPYVIKTREQAVEMYVRILEEE